MFDVGSGGDRDRALNAAFSMDVALRLGLVRKMVPLNGGSDTRADAREYHLEYARRLGVPAQSFGNSLVIIGWDRADSAKRGRVYVRSGHRQMWWHRRKAKRFQRKRVCVILRTYEAA